METNKKLRLIIVLQLITIVLLLARIVWEETTPTTNMAGTVAIESTDAANEKTTQESALKSLDLLPNTLFSTSEFKSIPIGVGRADTITKFYRGYLKLYSALKPGRRNLYQSMHGTRPDSTVSSVASYHILTAHAQDLINQTAANVLVIFPAFRTLPTAAQPNPEYTFVLAAGIKNSSTGEISIIKSRRVARADGFMGSVIYDELGPCPKDCPGFE